MEEEGVEVEVEGEVERQLAEQPREEGETRNYSEQNHPPSVGIDKTSTDSCQIFRDICP